MQQGPLRCSPPNNKQSTKMTTLTPIQQLSAEQLFHEDEAKKASLKKEELLKEVERLSSLIEDSNAKAAAAAEKKASLELAQASAPPTKEVRIPFVSLVDVPMWKKHFAKSFEQPVSKESDVKPGFKGNLSVGYHIYQSLDPVLSESSDMVQSVIDLNVIYPEGKPLGKKSIKDAVVPFFELSKQKGDVYFGIKKGTKGLWLAKKTGDYHYQAETTNDYDGAYKHRFSFEIVRSLTEEEGKLPHHLDLIKYKTVAVPV